MTLIKERTVKLQELINEKREGLKAIEMRMMQMAQMQAQQQQNAGMQKKWCI